MFESLGKMFVVERGPKLQFLNLCGLNGLVRGSAITVKQVKLMISYFGSMYFGFIVPRTVSPQRVPVVCQEGMMGHLHPQVKGFEYKMDFKLFSLH